MIMDLEKIIDNFNNNEYDITSYFGGYKTFFNFLNKRGLISKVDIYNPEYQNHYLMWLHDEDFKQFNKFVVNILSDLVMDEDGKIYLDIADRSELSELFCTRGRNTLSISQVANLLRGDSEYWFDYSTNDIYRDVISELNPKNMKILEQHIVDSLKNVEVEPKTELLRELSKEQGSADLVKIDSSIISDIIDDEDTINYLLENYLDELNGNLNSLHSQAYTTAYEDQMHSAVMNELQEYFDGYGEFYSRPHSFKKNTMTERFRIPVASNFNDIIMDYLDQGKNSLSRGSLEYFGSYISLVQDSQDCLSVYPDDYPDSSKVDTLVNELFTDYI
jgi:hypothetical protein